MTGAIFRGGKIAEGNQLALNFTISSNQSDVDLYDYLVANEGYSGGSVPINILIDSGVNISSTSTGNAGLIINKADFDAGVVITLTNDGTIRGKGGAGGGSAAVGSAAGGGLEVLTGSCTLDIDNTSGEINGGGGGGGGGGTSPGYVLNGKTCNGACSTATGGSGGAGYGPNAAASGSTGSTTSCGCANGTGGTGGAGGGKGAAGSSGANGSPSNGNAKSGGAAGYAVSGNSYVDSWIATGTRNGSVS